MRDRDVVDSLLPTLLQLLTNDIFEILKLETCVVRSDVKCTIYSDSRIGIDFGMIPVFAGIGIKDIKIERWLESE